ncbi:hypothetical protein Tco_1120089 [Tanacetum coccineum]
MSPKDQNFIASNANPKDILNPTTALDMALELMAKAFQLNNTTPINNNQRSSSNLCYSQVAQSVQNQGIQNVGNQNGLSVISGIANQHENGNVVAARAEGNGNGINGNPIKCYNYQGEGHYTSNCTLKPRKIDDAYLQTQLQINQKKEDNLQQASTSGTQTNNTPIYDSDGPAECGTRWGTIQQHSTTVEETYAYHESLFHNLAAEVEKVKSVNRKMKETNAELTTELARYKNQEKCFEISQEKYDKLERCYQKSVYQEQCLTKKINALHLSLAQQKQQSLYNGKVLSEKHDPPAVYDSEETLQLAQESDESLAKRKALELEIKRLLRAVVSQDIMSIVQKAAKFVRDFKSLAKEADESLVKHKALELDIERLLRAVVSQDIMSIVQNPSVVDTSNLQTELEHTLDPLSQKLENENVELELQVLNYAKENSHLKTTYKKLLDSISVTRAKTKTIIDLCKINYMTRFMKMLS